MTAPTLNRRLTVDLRPGKRPPALPERDHQVLANGLLEFMCRNEIPVDDARQILEHYRERMPGQGHLDEAILRQVRTVYKIGEQP